MAAVPVTVPSRGSRVDGDDGPVDTVEVDRILVAAGRVPNVEGLGLDHAGVAWTRKGVTVDAHLRTSNRAVFAAGDVCLPQQFTHAADASARAVIQNALFLGRKRVATAAIPRCTYTDPEVAHVGEMTGDGIDTFHVAWADVDRARTDDERVGGVRVYARAGKVVGGTVVGRDAGDLIGEIAVLAARRVALSTLAGIVHPVPDPRRGHPQGGRPLQPDPPDANGARVLRSLARMATLAAPRRPPRRRSRSSWSGVIAAHACSSATCLRCWAGSVRRA